MAENSGFFNAEAISGNTYDRVYMAENFAKYFASFIGNGFFGGSLGELQVIALNSGTMTVAVQTGQGWINGYWYENTSQLEFPIGGSSATLNRIDSIILRLDLALRTIKLAVIQGTPAVVPVAPSLTRDEYIYELRLANVTINQNSTQIVSADIYDTRLDPAECGVVKGVIEQIDTTTYAGQLQQFINQYIAKANTEYNNVFLHGLATIQSAAQTSYNNFLAWLEALQVQIQTDKDQTFQELQDIIDEFNEMIIGDPFAELVSRVDNLYTYLPDNSLGQIVHDLNEYPAVFAYEYTNGPEVSIDSDGIVTGATLTSTTVQWSMPNQNSLTLSTKSTYGTVASITKVNDRTYNILFSDTTYGVYIKLGGGGGGSGGDTIYPVAHQMFEVYYSQSSLEDDNKGAVKGWIGQLVSNASTAYPDFYQALKNNHPELQTTIADYNARVAATGSCSLYVIDSDNAGNSLVGAIKFPTLANYIRGPRSGETVSTELGDAIRNISGILSGINATYANPFVSGPFKWGDTDNLATNLITIQGSKTTVFFDASLSVPTASENRPKTQVMYPWIVVANAEIQTARQMVDVPTSEVLQQLANKIDKPTNNTVTGNLQWNANGQYASVETSSKYVAPDYANIETINRIPSNNGTWKATRSGWVTCSASITSTNGRFRVIINGVVCWIFGMPLANNTYKITAQVKKDDVIQVSVDVGTFSHCDCFFIPAKYVDFD